MFFERFEKELETLKEKNLYRQRIVLPDGVLDFSSNDYLGLKDCKKTKELLCKNIHNLSLGSGASALISGYTEIQKQLEEELAKFKETESCIVVGSGYTANTGLIPALVREEDTVLSDEYNHASIIDGIRLTKSEKIIYRHCDVEDLERKIKNRKNSGQVFIITDGVFSMEGDIAPLDRIKEIADRYDAIVIVDDAHSTGILGNGKGTIFHFGLSVDRNIIQMGTLSKAVGSYGAFICAPKIVIDYLVNKMRTAIFTTALSPIQNFISLQNLRILQKEPHRRKIVLENTQYLVSSLGEAGFNVSFRGTPIIPILINDENKALKIRDELLEKGIFIQAIRPPTVPEGTSRLRITVSYKHKKDDIDRLIEGLKSVMY